MVLPARPEPEAASGSESEPEESVAASSGGARNRRNPAPDTSPAHSQGTRKGKERDSRFVELSEGEDPEEAFLHHECAKARAVIYANLAACHLKLDDNNAAVKACNEGESRCLCSQMMFKCRAICAYIGHARDVQPWSTIRRTSKRSIDAHRQTKPLQIGLHSVQLSMVSAGWQSRDAHASSSHTSLCGSEMQRQNSRPARLQDALAAARHACFLALDVAHKAARASSSHRRGWQEGERRDDAEAQRRWGQRTG